MPRVEIYTKMFCPYCTRAKRLLSDKGLAFEEYDITLGGAKRDEMLAFIREGQTARITSAAWWTMLHRDRPCLPSVNSSTVSGWPE